MFQIDRKEYIKMTEVLGELGDVLKEKREIQNLRLEQNKGVFQGAAGAVFGASMSHILREGVYEKAYRQSRKMRESMESLQPLVSRLLEEEKLLAEQLEADDVIYPGEVYMGGGEEIVMLDEFNYSLLMQKCEDLEERGKSIKNHMQEAIDLCSGLIDCTAEQEAISDAWRSVERIKTFRRAFRKYVMGVRDLDETLRFDFQAFTDMDAVKAGREMREAVYYEKRLEKIRTILEKPLEEWTEEEKDFLEENSQLVENEGGRAALREMRNQRYVDNLRYSDLNISEEKRETLCTMAEVLLAEGYAPAFVAGMLGNIMVEGNIGQFEDSTYITHPEKKKEYLQYMDDHYDYANKYSNKSIMEVGISETADVLKQLKEENSIGKFGLGCVQWTKGRTENLIECYKIVCGESNYPTFEQCIEAECMLIVQELKGDYHSVYDDWCLNLDETNSVESAVQAGIDVYGKYETPDEDTSVQRGEAAGKIYEIFVGGGKR